MPHVLGLSFSVYDKPIPLLLEISHCLVPADASQIFPLPSLSSAPELSLTHSDCSVWRLLPDILPRHRHAYTPSPPRSLTLVLALPFLTHEQKKSVPPP